MMDCEIKEKTARSLSHPNMSCGVRVMAAMRGGIPQRSWVSSIRGFGSFGEAICRGQSICPLAQTTAVAWHPELARISLCFAGKESLRHLATTFRGFEGHSLRRALPLHAEFRWDVQRSAAPGNGLRQAAFRQKCTAGGYLSGKRAGSHDPEPACGESTFVGPQKLPPGGIAQPAGGSLDPVSNP